MKLLSKGHAVVAKAASTGETRYVMNGVYLEETAAGMRATATDGCILATVEDRNGALAAEEFPANVMPADAPNGAAHAIVPTEAYLGAFKALPKRSKLPILERVAVVMGAKQTTLGVTDLQSPTVKTVTHIDGAYPAYAPLLKTKKAVVTIAFDPTILGKACQIAQQFGLYSMKMEFTDALSPVKITGSKGGQDLTILVMPVRL